MGAPLSVSDHFTHLTAELDKRWAQTLSRELARVRDEAALNQEAARSLASSQQTRNFEVTEAAVQSEDSRSPSTAQNAELCQGPESPKYLFTKIK
ncbi:unnamed protein product [Protopolystoma xenopodis]|uniref:Uncharacterized protein n=1 Tax=Protopolystoma xenopodis TaxID=117903 RepID=A0A448XHQ4_9PLAT|nr:unnamed protein product [Protopolystoma xenopodis]